MQQLDKARNDLQVAEVGPILVALALAVFAIVSIRSLRDRFCEPHGALVQRTGWPRRYHCIVG